MGLKPEKQTFFSKLQVKKKIFKTALSNVTNSLGYRIDVKLLGYFLLP